MQRKRRVLLDWLIPLAILVGLTLLFRFTNIDVDIEGRFFDPSKGWVHGEKQPWRFLYEYGTIPAQVVAWASFAVFVGSFWIRRIKPYRIVAIFLALVMVIGPGLIVNTTFKQRWGRPRPLDLQVFAGEKTYLPVWEKGVAGEGESFPSGHASMGFYWFTPFFFLRRSSRKWAILFLALGLFYGSLMGLGRMIQGSHFFSDVVWAAGFVYLIGLGFHYLLRLDRRGVVMRPA